MDAYDLFYEAVEDGCIPAVVPARDPESGLTGAFAVSISFEDTSAEEIVLSDNEETRAVAAIFACQRARERTADQSLAPA